MTVVAWTWVNQIEKSGEYLASITSGHFETKRKNGKTEDDAVSDNDDDDYEDDDDDDNDDGLTIDLTIVDCEESSLGG